MRRPKPIEKPTPKGSREDENLFALLREIRRYPVLKLTEEKAIIARLPAVEARQKLCLHNLRFALKIAMKYQGQGLPKLDLISEASAGLMLAAQHFNPGAGWRFISYAVWWIRAAITRALHQSARTIRLSAQQELVISKVRHANLTQVIGGDWVEDLSREKRPERLRRALLSSSLASLDGSGPEGGTPADFLAIDTPSPEAGIEEEDGRRRVKHCLSFLTPMERHIVSMVYGLHGGEPLTLQDLGERYGLSRERIRQIRNGALRKMKAQKTNPRSRPCAKP